MWVSVCVVYVMCGCFDNCVGVLVICVLVFIAFLYLSLSLLILIFTIVRDTATE